MRGLIVDDFALVRQRLIAMLSQGVPEMQIVGEAENPVEATNSIRRINPDVVILDIRLLGGSGIDVLREIKKRNGRPVVIMLTNFADRWHREKCMQAGADFFFDKSSEFHKVVEVCKQLIAHGHS